MKSPWWREVVKEEKFATSRHPPGTFSKLLTLSCGHQVRRRGGVRTPKEVYCFHCEYPSSLHACNQMKRRPIERKASNHMNLIETLTKRLLDDKELKGLEFERVIVGFRTQVEKRTVSIPIKLRDQESAQENTYYLCLDLDTSRAWLSNGYSRISAIIKVEPTTILEPCPEM